jgi:hypothetical protein
VQKKSRFGSVPTAPANSGVSTSNTDFCSKKRRIFWSICALKRKWFPEQLGRQSWLEPVKHSWLINLNKLLTTTL